MGLLFPFNRIYLKGAIASGVGFLLSSLLLSSPLLFILPRARCSIQSFCLFAAFPSSWIHRSTLQPARWCRLDATPTTTATATSTATARSETIQVREAFSHDSWCGADCHDQACKEIAWQSLSSLWSQQ